jgi:hypothetical protein
MGNLHWPYAAFVSKFWAVEDVITRSRTASGHVDGAGLATCDQAHGLGGLALIYDHVTAERRTV